MKKIFLIVLIFLSLPLSAHAQSTNSENNKVESKIDQIKDKVASRVAELKLVERRGIIGVVTEVKGNQITVNDIKENTRIIEVDELTKFSSEDNESFDLSDIKKGSKISALGIYNKESEKLLARYFNEINIPLFINGVITTKDKDNFTITLSTENKKAYLVDVERVTKIYTFSNGNLESAGFTDINTMENAIIVGFPDPKENNRITANRIIIFPGSPKNPKIEIIKNSSSPSISPATKNDN